MGDFRGLAQKLDYLRDLGVTALWLLPFSPSPWRDDGYDISDYMDVHPSYGTIRDFQHFLKEAHRRGLRVITEVVMNHTSDRHPWFQRARRAPAGSKHRDFYVWSDTPEKYPDARVIFKDFETSNWTWDPVAKSYYWHRFYSHQPDLNFDNPQVREAIKDVADFWLDMGVDGFRLDAIPYLYEREGTNCDNLPETHEYLRSLRKHVDDHFPGRLLLAEANQWPEDAIAYFGKGDECNMAFHFPLMPRLFMAIRMEDRFPILEILDQTPAIPDNCQWAVFLRNHDELTLEMVTDEERDYMYRVYAHDRQMRINLGIRRRLAPLLGNDRRKIELMNALLLSMPGTPVFYYGDEIGMGDNVYLGDRNGVRTPMQWSADRNAGFSRANPQKLYLPIIIDPEYHYEAVNVEAQQNNPHSLLRWMMRLIQQRKQYKAFGRGTLEFLNPSNRRVIAYLRQHEGEIVLVVANLSRFPQYAQLDLGRWKGLKLVEMFGRTRFPSIGDTTYGITLAAYGFYWFAIEKRMTVTESTDTGGTGAEKPVIEVEAWPESIGTEVPAALIRMIPQFLPTRSWFLGKGRTILNTTIVDVIAIPETHAFIGIVRVEYAGGDPEMYVMPGAIASGDAAQKLLDQTSDLVLARIRSRDGKTGVLYSGIWDPRLAAALLNAMAKRRKFRGLNGELSASHTRAFRHIWGPNHPVLESSVLRAEQRNSSVAFGDRFVMKVFRRVEPGVNPEIEVSRFLTDNAVDAAPTLAGSIEYRPEGDDPISIGILTGYIPNQGDAWRYTLDALGRFFETAITRNDRLPLAKLTGNLGAVPEPVHELMGDYAESARLLGRRLAELHNCLASDPTDPDFAPEPFTDHYRQGLFHGMTANARRAFSALDSRVDQLPADAADPARKVLLRRNDIMECFRPIRERRFETQRIRIHGDLNLRQILHTGKDFRIIDLEGQPSQSYGERRIKRHPLRDVTGVMRSMHYAAHAVMFGRVPGITPKPEQIPNYEHWASFWASWASALLLDGYLPVARQSTYLPETLDDMKALLDAYLMERALAELNFELNDRPSWVVIPLSGVLSCLDR